MNYYHRNACVLGFLFYFSCSASAAPISGIYVFGDSLSDQGNVSALTRGGVPGTDYFNGRFSNGLVYTDDMANNLGLPLAPASIIGPPWSPGNGNNFAYGGARTDGHRSGLPLGLDSQISAFLNGTVTASSDYLYIVFAGANDIQDAIGVANDAPLQAPAAMANPSAAAASVQHAASNVAKAVADLASAGAAHFLVPNSPNWALVPAVTEIESNNLGTLTGYGAFATETSQAFNNQLTLELGTLASANTSISIIAFDFFELFQDIVGNPANYGFTDVTSSCYDGDDLGFTGNALNLSGRSHTEALRACDRWGF